MTGWLVAMALWAVGIYPAYTGAVESANNDPEFTEEDAGAIKVATIAVAIFWPVAAAIELAAAALGYQEGPYGPRE